MMSRDDKLPRVAIIGGGSSVGLAMASLALSGFRAIPISDEVTIQRNMPSLREYAAPIFDPWAARRHDERREFNHPIHQRLFNPVTAAEHVTVTEPPLTKRQRRRLRGKVGTTPAKATEARMAETGTGSVHDGAVPQAFAQTSTPGDPA